MLIQRDQVIAGIPAPRVREVMRELMHCAMSAKVLAERFDDHDATGIVALLESEGLVEAQPPYSSGQFATADDEDWRTATRYRTTIAGNALAKARIGKPMTRDRADEVLRGLLDRVEAENVDPTGLFWVDSVSVFGSYADDRSELVGDVDVLLVYRHRFAADEHRERNAALVLAEHAKGRSRHMSFYEELTWAEDRFFKRLRARQSRLDIQFDRTGGRDALPAGATTREVYRRQDTS